MTEIPAAAPEKKKISFRTGLLIYAFALLLLCALALLVLHLYLGAYETSQPKHVLEAYRASLEEKLPEAAAESLGDLDPAIQAPEESQRWAASLLQGVSLVKDPAHSTEEQLVYFIKTAEGTRVGTVTFAVTGKGSFGMPVWEPVQEAFDFSPYYRMVALSVPPEYTVYLGGLRLGPDQILDSAVHYDALEECYLHYENLPVLVRYEGGPFLGAPELRVCDGSGQEVPLEELTQEHFLDHCPEEDKAAVEAFLPEFLQTYVLYSADIHGSAMRYFLDIRAMAVPGGPFHTRLQQAVGSFGWSNTRSVKILSMEVRSVTDLGDGRFLADVGYQTEITALEGPVEVSDQIRVLLVYYQGELRVDSLYHY